MHTFYLRLIYVRKQQNKKSVHAHSILKLQKKKINKKLK
jgi:hypothetical protein